MKVIVRFFIIIFLLVGLFSLGSCGGSDYSNTNITVVSDAAEGLNLQALPAIIKRVKSSEDFERELNKPGGINNLDLNQDGNVDYIKVTEYGGINNSFGFSLTVEPVAGEVQEIATIEIKKSGKTADVYVSGNQQVYGAGHHYHENHFWRNMFIVSYFTNGFGMWHSPYRYGYYPSYYQTYTTVPRGVYHDRTRAYDTQAKRTSAPKSTISKSNPNKGKTASKGISARLKNPTSTQKQFQSRAASKRVKSGGFGRKSSTSRSRSSFGGGK